MENIRSIVANLTLNSKYGLESQKKDAKKAIEDFSVALNSISDKDIEDNFKELRPYVFKARTLKKILILENLYKEEDINLDINKFETVRNKLQKK